MVPGYSRVMTRQGLYSAAGATARPLIAQWWIMDFITVDIVTQFAAIVIISLSNLFVWVELATAVDAKAFAVRRYDVSPTTLTTQQLISVVSFREYSIRFTVDPPQVLGRSAPTELSFVFAIYSGDVLDWRMNLYDRAAYKFEGGLKINHNTPNKLKSTFCLWPTIISLTVLIF